MVGLLALIGVGLLTIPSMLPPFPAGSDPTDNDVGVHILNDVGQVVTFQQCGSSCKPDGITESDSVNPGQSFNTYVSLGVQSSWLVSVENHGVTGCLPILIPRRHRVSEIFKVSAAVPAKNCSKLLTGVPHPDAHSALDDSREFGRFNAFTRRFSIRRSTHRAEHCVLAATSCGPRRPIGPRPFSSVSTGHPSVVSRSPQIG